MAKVIVFHYTDEGRFPPLSSGELTDLKKKLDSELKNHPNLTLNGTFVDDSGRGFCDWDAPCRGCQRGLEDCAWRTTC